MNALKETCTVSEDWEGKIFVGIHLRWDYANKNVHLAMSGYVQGSLQQFNHKTPKRRRESPYIHATPIWGATVQYAEIAKELPKLDAKGKKFVQQVTGNLLFLGREIDSTLLMPLSAIASQQAAPTEETMAHSKHIIDYITSQEDAVLTYSTSNMVLAVHSDVGYHSKSKARSRAGEHFFLSTNTDIPPNNGAILNISQIIKAVMSSAAESELGGIFINAKEAVHLRNILTEMGHLKPPTQMQTDNSTANGVINNKIQPKQTKSMDMRFHWLRDRDTRLQFRFHWRPCTSNMADYWTKHESSKQHRNVRREHLTPVETIRIFFNQKMEEISC